MQITLHAEDDAVRDALSRLLRTGHDLAPALRTIGEHLLNTTRQRFTDQTDPQGRPWAPLSETTRSRKKRNIDKILTEQGYLRGNLHYRTGSDYVETGSPSVYANTHQFGAAKGRFGSFSVIAKAIRGKDTRLQSRPTVALPWGDIPARPFLGLSEEDRAEIVDTINEFIARQWQ